MADGRSSASVVVVDPEKAARERDRAARALLSGTSAEQLTLFTATGLELTVPYSLKIVTSSKQHEQAQTDADHILRSAFQLADEVINDFNPNSELSAVSKLPVGKAHVMSAPLKRILACCKKVYNSSGGSFDPSVRPVQKFLLAAAKAGEVPNKEKLDYLIKACTFSNSFVIDNEKGTIKRLHADAELDLGGVGKGYIVDYVVEKLNALGYANVLFDWGGDCRASGENAQNQSWAVGIVRPPTMQELESEEKKEPSFLRVITLNNEALATSGDYENLTKDPTTGALYCSTFNWKAKALIRPSQHELAQVSVKCYSTMYADALATASFAKRDPVPVRYMLDNWRHSRDTVTDYTAYTRENERVARMFETAQAGNENRIKRIAGALPARVIIIGGGLAGQSAAIEAANCGAQVVLLEKFAKLGGNSAKATSGINGWGTRAQAQADVADEGKYFERDTFKSGVGGTCDSGLVKTLSVKSADAIKFLCNLNIPLTVLSQLGGQSRKRTHRAPDMKDGTPVPIGYTIMQTLEKHITSNLSHKITVMTEATVTSLLHNTYNRADGVKQVQVTGVVFTKNGETSRLLGDAVILATGGFSNDQTNSSLLREYAPQLFGYPTTNGTWATGDGVKMARSIGASLVDMDKVQLHPTGLIDPKDPANGTKYLGPEALRGSGGILLNKRGKRFINELDLRSVVSSAINGEGDEFPGSNGSKFAYCVLNDAAVKLFGVNSLGFYMNKLGLFEKIDSLPNLAKLIGCDAGQLEKTLLEYQEVSSANGICTLTGKTVFPSVIGVTGPYYVAYVTPSIHYTMGGCLISPSGEVQSDAPNVSLFGNRRPILGLFGAGEVTGGVHGGNRLGGNSLLECVVFGRVAGDRAATILQKKKTALSFTDWATVVLREVREGGVYGAGSRVLRFNLPGALQRSGLSLGQFIGIRGEWDGQQLVGYYSPITLPDDLGVIGILARSDKGNLREWISALQPGDAVEMRACGGLVIDRVFPKRHMVFQKNVIRKFALIAGGTGIAPMLQIVRACLKRPFVDNIETIRLVYAAEDVSELTYREVLEAYQRQSEDKFQCTFVLNRPPPQWTDGVGFIDRSILRSSVPAPANDLLVCICGPPVMQRVVKASLAGLGYNMKQVRTVDEVDTPPSKI